VDGAVVLSWAQDLRTQLAGEIELLGGQGIDRDRLADLRRRRQELTG